MRISNVREWEHLEKQNYALGLAYKLSNEDDFFHQNCINNKIERKGDARMHMHIQACNVYVCIALYIWSCMHAYYIFFSNLLYEAEI